jgi:hypothetical protein
MTGRKVTIDMVSGGKMYKPSFIKIGSGFWKFGVGEDVHTDTEQDDFISLLSFFKNLESGQRVNKVLMWVVNSLF